MVNISFVFVPQKIKFHDFENLKFVTKMATSLCSLSKSKVQKFEKIVPQNLMTYKKSFGSERVGKISFSAVCVTHEKKIGSERV